MTDSELGLVTWYSPVFSITDWQVLGLDAVKGGVSECEIATLHLPERSHSQSLRFPGALLWEVWLVVLFTWPKQSLGHANAPLPVFISGRAVGTPVFWPAFSAHPGKIRQRGSSWLQGFASYLKAASEVSLPPVDGCTGETLDWNLDFWVVLQGVASQMVSSVAGQLCLWPKALFKKPPQFILPTALDRNLLGHALSIWTL